MCIGLANIHIMRTNIEIDDRLMKDTLKITGLKTKREVVELALKELLRLHRQADLKKLKGKFYWEGDLEKMRLDK
jgi:Arc/MetJ family transcription regulator